jgi:hypothetical protein
VPLLCAVLVDSRRQSFPVPCLPGGGDVDTRRSERATRVLKRHFVCTYVSHELTVSFFRVKCRGKQHVASYVPGAREGDEGKVTWLVIPYWLALSSSVRPIAALVPCIRTG